jgi:hypothetical protein
VDGVDVLHGEVEGLRAGRRREPTLRWIEDGEDDAAAIEVMTRAGMALAFGGEELRVERCGLIEVRHFDGDTEQLGGIGSHGYFLFFV